jgi:hypothetical protein
VIDDNLAELPLCDVRGNAECLSVQLVGNSKHISVTLTGLPGCKKAATSVRTGAQLIEFPAIPDIHYTLREQRDGKP